MGFNCMGPLTCKFFSKSILENILEICDNLKQDFPFSGSLYYKNTVYNTYMKYVVIVYVISKTSD